MPLLMTNPSLPREDQTLKAFLWKPLQSLRVFELHKIPLHIREKPRSIMYSFCFCVRTLYSPATESLRIQQVQTGEKIQALAG